MLRMQVFYRAVTSETIAADYSVRLVFKQIIFPKIIVQSPEPITVYVPVIKIRLIITMYIIVDLFEYIKKFGTRYSVILHYAEENPRQPSVISHVDGINI